MPSSKAISRLQRSTLLKSLSWEVVIDMYMIIEYYDPEVRDFCLVLLENIFKLFSLPIAPI